MPWGWQSFAEYLDVLDKMPRTLDAGGMITHGAVRAFVMGERGAKNEPATEEDIAKMAAIVKDAVLAGALGFSKFHARWCIRPMTVNPFPVRLPMKMS